MMSRLLPFLTVALLAPAAFAQTPPADNNAVAFGAKLSMSTMASTLQAGGYQALIGPRPPNMPELMEGTITTGIGGIKVTMYVGRCPNSKNGELCAINMIASYNDEKNQINPENLERANKISGMTKVIKIIRPDQTVGFNIAYSYLVKDIDDPKFLPFLLQSFAGDVTRVLQLYNSGFQTPAPAAPATPAAPAKPQ